MRFYLPYAAGVLLAVADQLSKEYIRRTLDVGDGFAVIPGWFNIVHVTNRGAVFGLLNNPGSSWQTWMFAAASALAVGLIIALLRDKTQPATYRLALGMILGGAVGNLVDRLLLGHVTDFLDVYYNSYHWPAFNVADAALVVGAALLAWSVLTARRHVSDPA